jgi:hypothetical protein
MAEMLAIFAEFHAFPRFIGAHRKVAARCACTSSHSASMALASSFFLPPLFPALDCSAGVGMRAEPFIS